MQTETFTLGPLTMYVSEDHRFGTDAFLLAYYANVKPTAWFAICAPAAE